MEPLVLLYNLGSLDPVGRKLAKVLEERNIRKLEVGKTELAEKIGTLVGIPGFESEGLDWEGEIPTTQFLLMSEFDEEGMDAFLLALRTEGIYIPHKAMLTWSNKDFSLGQLILEVEREHAEIMAQRTKKAER